VPVEDAAMRCPVKLTESRAERISLGQSVPKDNYRSIDLTEIKNIFIFHLPGPLFQNLLIHNSSFDPNHIGALE